MTATMPLCGSCGAAPARPDARFCDACGSPLSATESSAEFKHVTVLFADVVRSMDMAASLGPERLREIRRALGPDFANASQERFYDSQARELLYSGAMGAGKDTLAARIRLVFPQAGYTVRKFGTILREAVTVLTGFVFTFPQRYHVLAPLLVTHIASDGTLAS